MADVPVIESTSKVPTRKWIAAQVVALAAIATMAVTTGDWNTEESVALIGWFVQAATTYLVPNDPTPGGVPGATWTHVEDEPLDAAPVPEGTVVPTPPTGVVPPE